MQTFLRVWALTLRASSVSLGQVGFHQSTQAFVPKSIRIWQYLYAKWLKIRRPWLVRIFCVRAWLVSHFYINSNHVCHVRRKLALSCFHKSCAALQEFHGERKRRENSLTTTHMKCSSCPCNIDSHLISGGLGFSSPISSSPLLPGTFICTHKRLSLFFDRRSSIGSENVDSGDKTPWTAMANPSPKWTRCRRTLPIISCSFFSSFCLIFLGHFEEIGGP